MSAGSHISNEKSAGLGAHKDLSQKLCLAGEYLYLPLRGLCSILRDACKSPGSLSDSWKRAGAVRQSGFKQDGAALLFSPCRTDCRPSFFQRWKSSCVEKTPLKRGQFEFYMTVRGLAFGRPEILKRLGYKNALWTILPAALNEAPV